MKHVFILNPKAGSGKRLAELQEKVRALAGEVEYKLGLGGMKPLNVEGRDNNAWVLVDYGYVIVHIFSREAREFYNLDKLYKGPRIDENNEENL